MANEIQSARDKVKEKLDIDSSDTTFNTMITEALHRAVFRLKPFVQYSIPVDTTVILSSSDSSLTLPVSGSRLQRLEKKISTDDYYQKVDGWRQDRDIVYLSETVSDSTTMRIFATRAYSNTDADFALLATDCPEAMLPLYLFAMAEFATYLVGMKRKFNIYQQMNGARTLAEMRELAEFYESRAVRILEDEISAEGQ